MAVELQYDHHHLHGRSPLSVLYYVQHEPLRCGVRVPHHHGMGPQSVLGSVVLGLARRLRRLMSMTAESTSKVYLDARTGWQRPMSKVRYCSSTGGRDRSKHLADGKGLSLLTFTINVVSATSKNNPAVICSSRRQLPKQLLSRPNVVEQAVTARSLAGIGQALSFALCSPQQLYVS